MPWKVTDLVSYVQTSFSDLADADKALAMQAYMKTDMPFYGIQKPQRLPIYKEVKRQFVPTSQQQYEQAVLALWSLPHREEKYTALEYAQAHKTFITCNSISLYEHLIREGGWWDLVDTLATQLVSTSYLNERSMLQPLIEQWIDDDNMWIRRAAILAHYKHKKQTDHTLLFAHCIKRAAENEFFIRKAIGWALREFSYSDPRRVEKFLLQNKKLLSPLSFREASKGLLRNDPNGALSS